MSIYKKLFGKFKKNKREMPEDVEYEGEDYFDEEGETYPKEQNENGLEEREYFGKEPSEEGYEGESDGRIEISDGGWEDSSEEEGTTNGGEATDADVKINYGGSGLLTTERRNKADIYRDIRLRVTDEDLQKIDEFIKDSVYVYEMYEKVENSGISLEVLVALGLTAESNIERYRIVQRRGLDTVEEPQQEDKEYDSYESEVLGQRSSDIPYKKKEVGIMDEVDEDERKEANEEKKENSETKSIQETEILVNKSVEDEEVSGKEDTGLVESTEVSEVSEEAEESIDDFGVSEALSKLMTIGASVDKVDIPLDENKIEVTQENTVDAVDLSTIVGTAEEESVTEPIKVYLVAEGYVVPDIEGYRFYHVTTSDDLDKYASSKDNLLVITPKIPKELMKSLGGWLKGITEDGEKYRIVTLVDQPVKHEKIEMEIELTEEGLDKYFTEFTERNYGETTSGSFPDILEMME